MGTCFWRRGARHVEKEARPKVKKMKSIALALAILLASAPSLAQDDAPAPADDANATKAEPLKTGQKCQPNANNEFVFKVNLWEYQYEVEGCEGVAPTLDIKRGVEYTLVQKDVSNWFHQWEEEGGENSYAVKITIPEDSKTAEFYYFCHIHSGMSGLMVVEDPAPDANKLVTPLAADYYGAPPQEFDVACGTYDNVTAFHENFDTFCPDMTFLCDTTGSDFSQCMEAIDCKMNYEMRVQEKEANKLAVFMEQMIPHHWNAILMSRIALKHATDSEGFDDEDLNVPQLMRNIINVQMMQIQQMEAWLETYGHKTVQCPSA